MRPCLIAIDIDGTLLGSDGRVSERNRTALLEAGRQGIEIVIATGRRHSYAMRVLRELDLPSGAAVVSSNGAVTRTVDARLIRRRHMPLATAQWLCRAVEPWRDSLVLTFDNVGEDGEDRPGALVCEAGNDALHASIGSWMRANEPFLKHVERMEHALAPSRVPQAAAGAGAAIALDEAEPEALEATPIQAMLCGTVERMAAAEARLAQHPAVAGVGDALFPGCEITLHRTAYPERDLAILDILPAGCSKAAALADLAGQRGCTLADVLAIGDNWNDLPMLEAAGKAVLMGNAPPELHVMAAEQGWTVGPTNDEDGVAVAIDLLLSMPSPAKK